MSRHTPRQVEQRDRESEPRDGMSHDRRLPESERHHAAAIASLMPTGLDFGEDPALWRAFFRMRLRSTIRLASGLHYITEREAKEFERAIAEVGGIHGRSNNATDWSAGPGGNQRNRSNLYDRKRRLPG